MKTPRRRTKLPCQLLSGRKSLGIGTCTLFAEKGRRSTQLGANVHIPASDFMALDHAFRASEILTLKVKFKYLDPIEAVSHKIECIIIELKRTTSDGADLELVFDGPVRPTTAARL